MEQDSRSERLVEGVDLYNFTITGMVAKTLHCVGATDSSHVPCIVVARRSSVSKDSTSGERR